MQDDTIFISSDWKQDDTIFISSDWKQYVAVDRSTQSVWEMISVPVSEENHRKIIIKDFDKLISDCSWGGVDPDPVKFVDASLCEGAGYDIYEVAKNVIYNNDGTCKSIFSAEVEKDVITGPDSTFVGILN